MKVWAQRRREDGAALASLVPVVEGASLLELLVVDTTLEGNRRTSKVARLQTIGEQRILAQLAVPELVQLKGWTLALSGIEERKGESKRVRGTSQTWVCQLYVPGNAVGFRVKDLHRAGVAIPRGAVREGSGTRGRLVVAGDHSNALHRNTTCAELHSHQIATFPQKRLINCSLLWMSDSTFELGGLHVSPAHDDRPEQLERAGWLCELDTEVRELSKREARLLR
ncbi:hypothetical protein GTP46_04675 [Duganella sp. FT135W]|uniref:Uncharacterized protein n=1 Tax=Duganella flavida TaxID=2692175 RepID=A0A6L8K372_9BURK|nr:hypothetical protein [Duganella flavida]MYM21943.1 hypothetical protein [Duganella flavida]